MTSTFIGAEDFDRAQGMTTDADGQHLPPRQHEVAETCRRRLERSARGLAGTTDAYLAKYSPDGKQLIWATYMGGPAEDRGTAYRSARTAQFTPWASPSRSIPHDARGRESTPARGDADFFVARFTSDGELIFSTVLGGSERDWSRGNFYVDDQGDVYIGGETESPNFPVTGNAIQKNSRRAELTASGQAFRGWQSVWIMRPTLAAASEMRRTAGFTFRRPTIPSTSRA